MVNSEKQQQQQQQLEKKIMTQYVYVRRHNRKPVGCIAYVVDEDKGTINYQVSSQHPDDEFTRKDARAVAKDKLNKTPIQIDLDTNHTYSRFEVLKVLMRGVARGGFVPTRVSRCARQWLTSHEEV